MLNESAPDKIQESPVIILCISIQQVAMRESSLSLVLQGLLNRLRAGDEKARDELIAHAYDRLVILSRRMLGRYSRLRAWEQTDDVAQNAMLRLNGALQKIQPTSVRDFIGLASTQIRRELLDLTRQHFGRERKKGPTGPPTPENEGPKRPAVKVFSQQAQDSQDQRPNGPELGDDTYDPGDLAMWREFHEKVQALPEQEREVVDLLWYQEMSQEDAADLLEVDKSTVKRRWRSARSRLHEALQGWLPVADQPAEEPPA